MKIIFLGYRSWALNTFKILSKNKKIKKKIVLKNVNQLKKIKLKNYDLLITLGWSSEINKRILSNITTIGLHCAEKDRYSYGTPIQNQIIDGLKKTKHRVFLWEYKKKSKRLHTHTRKYSHETTLSLKGSMNDIFINLENTSIILLTKFINTFPDKIKYKIWPEEKVVRKKRTPMDSKIKKSFFNKKKLIDIYNFIRCLEDPYPNAYIEDKFGKLLFKKVRYVKKN